MDPSTSSTKSKIPITKKNVTVIRTRSRPITTMKPTDQTSFPQDIDIEQLIKMHLKKSPLSIDYKNDKSKMENDQQNQEKEQNLSSSSSSESITKDDLAKLTSTDKKTISLPHINKTEKPSTSKYKNLNKIEDEEIDFMKPTIQYNKSINKRKHEYKRTSKSPDHLLFCHVCNGQGDLNNFLIPNYCSIECLKKTKSINTASNIENNNLSNRIKDNQKQQNTENESNLFVWENYLILNNANAASPELFFNPFPSDKNGFKEGMKLEAIDPENNSLFCVCTIHNVKGYRLKLHFDGYSDIYNFWVNANSVNIFPPGWCEKTNRNLQPPRGIDAKTFSWSKYLSETNSTGAPISLFTHLNSSSVHENPFKVGMRLEANDLKYSQEVCVASVSDVLNNRILVHFDGWDNRYDYWIDINSPYIYPVKHNFHIIGPPDWKKPFLWDYYIDVLQCEVATKDMFSKREPIKFKHGMRLEVVDKKNNALIRPATILVVDKYKIKVVFDGWPSEYAFWIFDDSPDIHPVNWCKLTGHKLEPPPSFGNLTKVVKCPVSYCRGIGNVNSTEVECHSNVDSCPYVFKNWIKVDDKSGRDEKTEYFKPINSQTKRKNETTVTTSKQSKIYKTDTKTTKNDENRKNNKKQTANDGDNYDDKNNVENKNNCYETIVINDNVDDDGHVLDNTKNDDLEIINLVDDDDDDDNHQQQQQQRQCNFNERINTSEESEMACFINTDIIDENNIGNPLKWSIDDVCKYVKKVTNSDEIACKFSKEEIDGQAFLSMGTTELTEILKIKLGPTMKIYNLIIKLREIYKTKSYIRNC